MAHLSTSEVKAILEAEKSDSLSAMQASKLSEDRSLAMDFYNGDMAEDMPSAPDRSKAVSTDVLDTIEGLMPALMEIFASGDDVVVFDPVGEEDEEAAAQETDYLNHVFMEKNAGFITLYSFIKDALLQKNGIVKCYWEDIEREETEERKGLTDVELAMILDADPDLEIVEHTTYPADAMPDPAGQPDGMGW